ncbi:hypothetical protein Z945_2117 [Sulfitobacter noctilucae]|uniref:hypothetical protein n=1 Tax=Sulfitobacter noctilucae TaxID=1342302 RepID=UPI0004689F82|nr:hypothetical protein [Sulfitobacter noctilucae]KIN61132.1 hypothetical protein Z945_2117 [Sulfitobacter noctilucae]
MTAIHLHPSELALLFSFAKVTEIVGWGDAPFQPGADGTGDMAAWYADGTARLKAAGRLVEKADKTVTFVPSLTEATLALVDPALVMMAERKEGSEGLRRLTVHLSDDALVGLTRQADGMFELTRYANLTAAAAACAAFLGTAPLPVTAGLKLETDMNNLRVMQTLADSGQQETALARLIDLGAPEAEAASLLNAMTAPSASGMLSLLYCADNVARNAQAYRVMTHAESDTWITTALGSPQGPMVIERSSITALTGRIMVTVAARMQLAA